VRYGVSRGRCRWRRARTTLSTAATTNGTELIFTLVSPHVWPILLDVGHILFVTSLFAATLVVHNTVTRYGFRVGPGTGAARALGRTNPKDRGAACGVDGANARLPGRRGWAMPRFTLTRWLYLFFWISVTGGLGVLILMWFTSAAGDRLLPGELDQRERVAARRRTRVGVPRVGHGPA